MDSVPAFKFSCPGCGQHLEAQAEEAGQVTVCPLCARKLVVPQAPAEGTKLMISAALAGGRVPRTPTTTSCSDPTRARRTPLRVGLWVAAGVAGTALVMSAALYVRTNGLGFGRSGAAKTTETTGHLWTTNFAQLKLGEQALVGSVNGWDFVGNRAVWRGTKLTLQQRGGSGLRDLDVELDLPVKGGELVAGKSFEASHEHGTLPKPVRILWEDDARQRHSRHFSSDYVLRLEITAVTDTHVSGRIHLCLPDEEQSWVAGRFDAEIRTKR